MVVLVIESQLYSSSISIFVAFHYKFQMKANFDLMSSQNQNWTSFQLNILHFTLFLWAPFLPQDITDMKHNGRCLFGITKNIEIDTKIVPIKYFAFYLLLGSHFGLQMRWTWKIIANSGSASPKILKVTYDLF